MVGWRRIGCGVTFVCSLAVSAHANEVKLLSIEPASGIATSLLKRVDRASSMGKKASVWSLSKAMNVQLFHSQTSIGKKFSPNPIALDLSVSAKPNISPGQLKLDRQIKASASKRLSTQVPFFLETTVKCDESRKVSVFVIFKFSL